MAANPRVSRGLRYGSRALESGILEEPIVICHEEITTSQLFHIYQ